MSDDPGDEKVTQPFDFYARGKKFVMRTAEGELVPYDPYDPKTFRKYAAKGLPFYTGKYMPPESETKSVNIPSELIDEEQADDLLARAAHLGESTARAVVALELITVMKQRIDEYNSRLEELVAEARAGGFSWQKIAKAMRMQTPTVFRKYRFVDDDGERSDP